MTPVLAVVEKSLRSVMGDDNNKNQKAKTKDQKIKSSI